MMPGVPRDLSELAVNPMGINMGPPIVGREEFDPRKRDHRRREMDRFNERERERGRSRELRGRSVERERERERSRERERERERDRDRQLERERERERERARDREPRREARESSAAVNDSTSMRRKDVCLFLSIAYLSKFCTVVSSMVVDICIPATAVDKDGGEAHGVLPDSGAAEQERNSVEPCLRSGSVLAFLFGRCFLPAPRQVCCLLGCSGHRQQQQFDHLEHFAVVIAFLGSLPIGDADAIGTADRFLVTFIFIYVHYVYFFSPLGLGCLFAFFLCPFFFHVFAF